MSVPSAARGTLTRRSALGVALTAAVAAAWPGATRAAPGAATAAEEFIERLGQEAIAVPQGGDPGARLDEVTALLDEAADVPLIARLVLGRHWRAASDAQRQEYVQRFRDYVLSGLARRLGGSGGVRRVEVTGSRAAGREDTMVGTEITLANGGPPARVEWRVRRAGVGGGFKIIDVVAEGVSLVVTNRGEFDAVVAQSGMDGLLEQMRRWSARTAALD